MTMGVARPAEEVTMAEDMTPLHVASAHGRLEDIQHLLATFTGLEALKQKDGLGRTPLYLAVRYNHVAAADLLLLAYRGASASQAIYKDELSLLHLAADCGHTAMVQRLLDALTHSEVRAALCRSYPDGSTKIPDKGEEVLCGSALDSAIWSGKVEIVQMLLSAPGGPTAIGLAWGNSRFTPFHRAAATGQAGIVAELLKACPSPAAIINLHVDDGYTALMMAAQDGHISVVEELLTSPHCDITATTAEYKWTALGCAAQQGHAAVIQQLLEALQPGDLPAALCDAEHNGNATPLSWAAMYGHTEAVERLLSVPAGLAAISIPSPVNGRTAVHFAAAADHASIVARLLQACPSPAAIINLQDEVGCTALMSAAHDGHVSVVVELLNLPECDITAKSTEEKWTALGFAAREGHAGVVQQLLSALQPGDFHTALCDAEHNKKATPLLWAARNGHTEAVERLLSVPAGLAAISIPALGSRSTAFHEAAEAGHAGIVAQLLHACPSPAAIINQKGHSGYTALMLAAKGGHAGVVEELLKHPECRKDIYGDWLSGRKTALGIAKKTGNSEIIALLL